MPDSLDVIGAVDAAIYTRLTGHAGLHTYVADRVYNSVAPESVTGDLVVFQCIPQSDEYAWPNQRFPVLRYEIRGIVKGDAGPKIQAASLIAEQIDNAMHDAALTPAGYDLLSCLRLVPLYYPEVRGDIVYTHRGGIYQVTLQKQ